MLGGPQSNGGWMSWTTYQRLMDDAGYWTGRFPTSLQERRFHVEGAAPEGHFFYGELAHVLVPRRFCRGMDTHEQDIESLSHVLELKGIRHELGALALQIRSF